MYSTSFGNDYTGPPALPCSREDALVDNGAAAPKSCFSPLEMRSPTATGGLLPTGETSTATKTTFDHPTFWFCLTEETNLRTSTQSVSYDSSFFWKSNLPAAPSCRRVIEAKLGQNRMFDPGGSRSSPRLPVFGNLARVVLWGGSLLLERLVAICSIFGESMTWASTCRSGACESFMPFILRLMFFSATNRSKKSCRRGRLEAIGGGGANGCQGASWSEA